MSGLRGLVEGAVGHSMDEYQFHHLGRPVDETRHGRQMVLKDYGIKNGSTLVLAKTGLKLDVTNPMVNYTTIGLCKSQ